MSVRFEDVFAWKKAYNFVLLTYKALSAYPENEKYGLCSQFKRAAVSVPANIAEGYKRIGKADKLHFFLILHKAALRNADVTYTCPRI